MKTVKVTIKDDTIVHTRNARGELVRPRPKGSVWWQEYRFPDDVSTNDSKNHAISHAKKRWPEGTHYSVEEVEDRESAPFYADLSA